MNLQIFLKVKFRAFGVTYGTFAPKFDLIPIPMPPTPPQVILDFDQRGVKLFIKLVQA